MIQCKETVSDDALRHVRDDCLHLHENICSRHLFPPVTLFVVRMIVP